MEEKLKELGEKAGNLFMKVTKMFDGISQKIYEQTGTKINVGFIVISVVLIIFALVLAVSTLKWLATML